jgi:hypothetical protein
MNKFIKTIPKEKVGYEFLHSLNGLLELTNKEIELLTEFLSIYVDKTKKDKGDSIDSAENRKYIMSSLSITKDNLSKYIKMFKEKRIFIKEGSYTTINKALIPIIIGNRVVQITMILKLKENEI